MPTETEIQLWSGWGRRVRARREALEMRSVDLALKCGLSAQRIHQIETGECGTSDRLRIKVADALGVGAGELFPYPVDPARAAS